MVEPNRERAVETERLDSSIRLAVAYYAIVGLIGAALGAWFVFSLASQFLIGYREFGAPGALCDHYLQDFIAPCVASVVGVTLLPTAIRLRRNPPALGPVVGWGSSSGSQWPCFRSS